jgi:hypothetical protein
MGLSSFVIGSSTLASLPLASLAFLEMPEQWIDVHDCETLKTGKDRIGVCKMCRQVTKLSKDGT